MLGTPFLNWEIILTTQAANGKPLLNVGLNDLKCG